MECIICFELVSATDLYKPECECKYTAHVQCIKEWNGTCIVCNKPKLPKPRLRREMITAAVCMFLILIIWSITILSPYH